MTWGACSSSTKFLISFMIATFLAASNLFNFTVNDVWMTWGACSSSSSTGAAAAGAGAEAPAIITGASEMLSFDFSKLFRSATSSKFKLEMSSTIRVIFSEYTLSLLGKGIASLLKDGLIEKFRQETTEIRWGPCAVSLRREQKDRPTNLFISANLLRSVIKLCKL